MQIKQGVNLQGLDIKIRPALVVAEKVYQAHGRELVITAGMDGTHSAGSLHYYGLAIDCRTRYFSSEEAKVVANELREKLRKIDKRFDVVLHSSHIHIEYDVIKEI